MCLVVAKILPKYKMNQLKFGFQFDLSNQQIHELHNKLIFENFG